MKRSLMLTLLLTAALPLCADEPKPAQPEAAAPATATATTATTPEESPLVRAARRANRLGRKPGTVITNESVKKSKGHITTTTNQRPLDIPKPAMASDEAAAIRKRNAAREQAKVLVIGEEKKKQQELEALERRARAAEMAEEGYFEDPDDDPARAERNADEGGRDDGANPPATNTPSEQKPPQG
jgi:hypothetical protein